MRSKVWLLACSIILCMASLSFALDFGGALDNSTEFKVAAENEVNQEDRLSIWLDAELGKSFDFFVMGSATLEYMSQTEEFTPYFDLDLLRLDGGFSTAGQEAPNFNLSMGRFAVSEFSGYVLNHVLDGVELGFRFPAADVMAYFGYSGLLFKHVSSVRISKMDAVEQADDDKWFGPSRLIGMVQVSFPHIFSAQTLSFGGLFQEDLRSDDDVILENEEDYLPGQGGRLDTQYLGVGLKGPIISSLYYDAFFYFGTGRMLTYQTDDGSGTGYSYQYETLISFLFGGGLKYYMRELLYSRLALSFVYATGDEDHVSFLEGNTEDFSTAFLPISYDSNIALVFPPQLSNIFLFDLSWSMRPLSGTNSYVLSRLQTILKGIAFFRSTKGPISEPGLNSNSDAIYLGTEIDLIVNFRPFSDLGTALSLGLFLPNAGDDGAFFASARQTEFLGRFELSFSF